MDTINLKGKMIRVITREGLEEWLKMWNSKKDAEVHINLEWMKEI